MPLVIYLFFLFFWRSYLHDLSIVYRDLKPENIMLQADGHVCLTDFGLAKYIDNTVAAPEEAAEAGVDPEAQRHTACGTIEYMAPEILACAAYGPSADWWAVGILLFEMLVGRTPFVGNNRAKTRDNIARGKLTLPNWVSYDAQQLIKKLLSRTVSKRPTFAQLKAHDFFVGIDWDALGRKDIPAPFIPPLVRPTSGHLFLAFTVRV